MARRRVCDGPFREAGRPLRSGSYRLIDFALSIEAVTRDAGDTSSKHDIGGSIMPMLVEAGEVAVYDFAHNEVPGATERDRG